MNLSVIICTHNPRSLYLERTLASLEAQTLQASDWELIVIDNGSREPVAERFPLLKQLGGTVLREETLGLTPARIRGIRESKHPLLVFVDDDNVLEPDYLAKALEIALAHPEMPVFGAGRVCPEFEVSPAAELSPFLGWLALRELTGDHISADPNDGLNPFGAGLCCSRAIAEKFIEHVSKLNMDHLGRKGAQLSSGEDMEFSWLAIQSGMHKGIFEDLGLKHLIPKERLTVEYFTKMAHDTAHSHVLLDASHGLTIPFFSAALHYYFGALKTAIHIARGNRITARIASAKRKGFYSGCRAVRNQNTIER